MLSRALQTILRRYFGEFITGLQNVELAFWTGKINIQNASFKHEKINQLLKLHNIPLSIKMSFLGNLQVDIPWNKLNSAPVQIKVSNVMIVLKLEKVMTNFQKVEDFRENAKLILIKNYMAYLAKKSEELNGQQQSQSGFLKKLLIKILHNLNLQIHNIHIRIQNNNNSIYQSLIGQDEFFDCKEENQMENLGFSLGFCIESIEAETINANNIKQFVRVEDNKTEIRKKINLRQISLYWQENNSINLFQLSQERKIDFLRKVIGRKQHRLLTIDGYILMERAKDEFDYFFSTSFKLLEIGSNYQQLKQFIEVYQQFMNAKAKKKIRRLNELPQQEQLKQESTFREIFRRLQESDFKKVTQSDVSVIQSLDKKNLLSWTKEEAIEIIKKIKLKEAIQNKNKKKWFGFLSKSAQNQLSQQEITQIQKEILKLLSMIDQQKFGKAIGFYIHFNLLRMVMDHHQVQQQLVFSAENLELQFETKKSNHIANISISDLSLIYYNLDKSSNVNIFANKKSSQSNSKFFELRITDNQAHQRIDFTLGQMCITHQIQFLSFLSAIIKLKERERMKGQVMFINPQLRVKKAQEDLSLASSKLYEHTVRMSRIQIKAQLSSTASLQSYIEGINIHKKDRQLNSHQAQITNFAIIFKQSAGRQSKDYYILQNMNIEIQLRKGFKVVQSSIPHLKLTINEQSLYYMVKCVKEQYKIIQIAKNQRKKQVIEEQKFMEGQTSVMGVFKGINLYHTVLTGDYLYFYQKNNGKVNYQKISKQLIMKNMKVSRIDEHSFKLQSVFVNQIITCKEQYQMQRWIRQIELRIFENNAKQQKFDLIEQQNCEGSPIIYIPYDSLINMKVSKLEIIYQKNTQEKILSILLQRLKVSLKENNLIFERKIDLDQISITNLSLQQDRQEYNLILSNIYNYFQDPNEDERSNIEVLIEGKKKTHPKYTGQVTIKSQVNKLFINYDAEFFYSILYRLVCGDAKEKYYSEEVKFLKILEIVKQLLEEKNVIDERYNGAKQFQFSRSYFQLQKYKLMFPCSVLFHVQIKCEDVEVVLINGRNHHWLDRCVIEGISIQLDKTTDFMFIKGQATTMSIFDLTGYPKTIKKPFTQGQPYPLIKPCQKRQHKMMLDFSAGVFEPMAFINRQRFKNYFMLNLYDAEANYQQQPLMRFIDFLTNQIILFILQPFSLHKYDSPNRGPFRFDSLNYTTEQVTKIIYECLYPFFTHLNISSSNMVVNFNSHPHDQFIQIKIGKVHFYSEPYMNPQKIHVRLDQLKRYENKYPFLKQILHSNLGFEQRITKNQWLTRYIISASKCKSEIFDEQFQYDMYFERSNNGDKDMLFPFLKIQKDFLMEGKIKSMTLISPRNIYNLVNKCFIFNLSYDEECDRLFNANHQYQHLGIPNKMIYRLMINQLSIIIPQLNKTGIVIESCQYKFLRYEDNRKQMEVVGKSLRIFDRNCNIISPFKQDNSRQKGLQYVIQMKPSGQKKMSTFLRHIDFHYNQQQIFPLFKYFLLDESCYPKQDVYGDLPLITCDVYLLNSYIKLIESQESIYALKGDIKVVWKRYQQPHSETYRLNKQLYPKDKNGSSYDIEFKGVTFRKYNKKMYSNIISKQQGNFYRSLSSSMILSISLTNVMKIQNNTTYTDMIGVYDINNLSLKLSFKDFLEISNSFKKNEDQEQEIVVVEQQHLGYTSQTKHKVNIAKMSLFLGLSELPVPLLDFSVQKSKFDFELLGKTKILTSQLDFNMNYWNMKIGRWQPIIEKSSIQITLKMSTNQKYIMATSNRQLLLNFSIQGIKVIKLLAKDLEEKGNLHIINKDERAKGIQISPYVITNRTGHNIIINSDFTLTAKLSNNQKIHLQNKNLQIEEKLSIINYQIEGDSNIYDLNINLNQAIKPTIIYNAQKYRLMISSIASSVLKEIVISSPYIIHNKTKYKFSMTIGQKVYEVQPDSKIPIPFNQPIGERKPIRIDFFHLPNITDNFPFEFRDIVNGFEHYIVYGDCQTFNCLVSLQSSHENVISISPLITFINLLPLNLKLEVAVTKLNKDKMIINDNIDVNKQKIFYQFGSKDEVSLRINIKGFNYSQFTHMNLRNNSASSDSNYSIIFRDARGLQAKIQSKIIKKGKCKQIYIYSQCVLINQTDYKFYVFKEGHLAAGQRIRDILDSGSKYVFLQDKIERLSLSFSDQNPYEGPRIKKPDQIGDQEIKIKYHYHQYQVIVSKFVSCLSEQASIFTSIIKISPKYIIVNKCRRQLAFQQENTDQQFYVPIGERKVWFWHNNQTNKNITVSIHDGEINLSDQWQYSLPFSLENLQETVLVVRPKAKSTDKFLLKMDVFKQNLQIFVIFKQLVQKEDSLIKIQNNLKLVNLQIYQECLNHPSLEDKSWAQYKHFTCPPLKQIDFGWDCPFQQHSMVLSFLFLGPYRSKFNNNVAIINIQKLKHAENIEFKGEDNEILVVEISIEVVGMRKKILIQNKDESQLSQFSDDDLMMQVSGDKIGISLFQIGISIIGGQQRRFEIIYMVIKRLNFIMTQKQQKRNYQLKIKYISIDNNSHHNTMFPVLFTPLKHKKTMQKSRPFFICLIEENMRTKQIKELNYIRICMEPISIRIYNQIINYFTDFSKAINSEDKQQKYSDIALTFRSADNSFQWADREIQRDENQTFIREIEIGQLVAELSFSLQTSSDGNIVLSTILIPFKALTNLSESQIILNRFLKNNMNLRNLINHLGSFYKTDILKEIHKLAGAVNAFGNPYRFIVYLLEGTWEILNQPSEGFIKGPLEGAFGIFYGVIYFLRNVLAAVFNSLEAFTYFISKFFGQITKDPKYLARRQKIQMQKSTHVLKGAKSALWALYTGIQVAITGLGRRTKTQNKKYGALGAMKGIALGLAGLFTIPLSGIFQAISKFSEGVKCTALYFQDGPNGMRSRPPRLFLSNMQYYTDYNLDQSKGVNLLQFTSTNYLEKIILFVSMDKDEGKIIYTILMQDHLVQVSKDKNKIIKQINTSDITEVDIRQKDGRKGLRIKHADHESFINTVKYKELYQCFEELFSAEEVDNDEDEFQDFEAV